MLRKTMKQAMVPSQRLRLGSTSGWMKRKAV
jgi:hypothetical protein